MSAPRRIRLVVGFSRTSASDRMAGALAPALARALATDVTIERLVGHDGADAAALVAKSPPDGTTLFLATLGTHVITPLLGGAYDPLADFSPVSLLVREPLIVAASRMSGLAEIGAVLEALRDGRELTFGCSAAAGAPRLSGELFGRMAGGRLRPEIYAETRALYDDLADGAIELTFNNIGSALPMARDGRFRALAVTSATRAAIAPELATVAEAGLPGYDVTNWLALVGPRGMPSDRVEALHAAAATAVREIAGGLAALGIDPVAGGPAILGDTIRSERERWAPIVAGFAGRDGRTAPDTTPAPAPVEEHP
jgi:tripartite-type tricarboxylate transporter receptor subunit TctC